MYQLWIYSQSDKDGYHATLFGLASKRETLYRNIKKRMSLPAYCWGFNLDNTAVIKRVGYADIIERVNLRSLHN